MGDSIHMLIMYVHMPTVKQDDHPGPVGGTEDDLASLALSIPFSQLTQFEKIGEGMNRFPLLFPPP